MSQRRENYLPQVLFDVTAELGFFAPAVGLDGLADVTLYIGGEGTGTVVVLVVALAGIDVDKMVLDGALHTARHVVIDSGETNRHTDGLVLAELGTVLSLHLRILQVDTGDIDPVLGFVTGKNVMEAVLTKQACLTEAGWVVVCLLCEDFFAGLLGFRFLFHL